MGNSYQFFLNDYFLEYFKIHSKIERKVLTFSTSPNMLIAFPIVNITHQNGTIFLTKDESILIYCNHSKPQFTFKFTLSVVHSMDFDKCIHPYGIVQNTEQFHCPPNPLCSTNSFLFPFNLWQSLIFYNSFAFFKASYI